MPNITLPPIPSEPYQFDQHPPFKTIGLDRFFEALLVAIESRRSECDTPNRLISLNTCTQSGLVRIVYERGQGTGKYLHLTYDRETGVFVDGYAKPPIKPPVTNE